MARRRPVEVEDPQSDAREGAAPAGGGGRGRFAGRGAAGVMRGLWRPPARAREPLVATKEIVNGLTRQELIAGAIATVVALGLTLDLYFQYRGHPGTTKGDIATRNDALNVLVVGLVGTVILGLGTALRRRALLGFASLLTGLAIGVLGIVFIAFGGWLIFRVWKKQKLDRAAGNGPPARRARASRAGGGRGGTAKAPVPPPRPPASKRYTPPRGTGAGARKR